MHYASFGSVSSGTLRHEDLVSAFADALDAMLRTQTTRFKRGPYRSLIREARKALRQAESEDLEYSFAALSEGLFEALSDFAPPYGYFGTHQGDGADFGFWVSWDAIEEAEHDGDMVRVPDLSSVPPDWAGYVLQVSDHGNCTLYHVSRPGGKAREVWGIV